MSHTAVNWALEQTGLKPAAKLVLICLADRHNRDTDECFPSQARLAEDACISRSSLNMQLAELEVLGLINRHPEIDPVTKRQMRTNYTFNAPFAGVDPVSKIETRAVSKKTGEPCPKKAKSRVQNLDTNPVREPISKPPCAQAHEAEAEEGSNSDFSEGFWTELLTALGIDLASPSKWWSGVRAHRHVARWLEAGLTEAQVIAVARKSRETHPTPPDGPKGLDAVMAAAVKPASTSAGRKGASGKATDAAQEATPEQMARFWAEKLRAGSYVAPSSLSLRIADLMLVLGLVAPSDLRGRGIAFTYGTPQGGQAA